MSLHWFRALAAAALVLAQVSVTPRARAENVKYVHLPGAIIQVTYDLVAEDPGAVFSVTLDASDDAGRTWAVKPKSLSGDVGTSVTAGAGKKIVWAAGKDVETVRTDQFLFRVNLVAAQSPLRTGQLSVRSTPVGAAVLVDGQPRGVTPIVIADLAAGAHQLLLQRSGYLENRQVVQIRENATETVAIDLTPTTPPTAPSIQPSSGGGHLKWLLLGGAGAAAGVGAAVAGGGGSSAAPPVTTTTTSIVPRGALTITSAPNPVPFRAGTGAPCNGTDGFWSYDEDVTETGGVAVTITQIFLRFQDANAFPTSPGAANDVIAARGTKRYSWFWCFTPPVTRHVKSNYAGRDANGNTFSFDGPLVVLSPGPGFQ